MTALDWADSSQISVADPKYLAQLDPEGWLDFTDRPRKLAPAKARRGTSNGNSAGSAEDRRRRRKWLLETYRADVDVLPYDDGDGNTGWEPVLRGVGVTACRCYRCGTLLTLETLTVDRIIPGAHGGTYRRNNIRPACSGCNSETGGATRAKPTKAR